MVDATKNGTSKKTLKWQYNPNTYGRYSLSEMEKITGVKKSTLNMRLRKVQLKFKKLFLENYRQLLIDKGYNCEL